VTPAAPYKLVCQSLGLLFNITCVLLLVVDRTFSISVGIQSCVLMNLQEDANAALKKATKIIANVIAGRNSAFSGQTFGCYS